MPVETKHKQEWLVLYSKPNSEKKLAEKLNKMGVEAYCPTRTVVRQWSDRKKKVKVPVLPSMVLVRTSFKNRNEVFIIPTAVRYLFWNNEPAVVSQEEVEALKESLESKKTIDHKVEEIKPGQELDLTEMGFENQTGEVKYVSGKQCWVVLKNLGFVVKLTLK
ncbi:MAG: UpxY family transcription antiterminator [Bacteroidota bacterium]